MSDVDFDLHGFVRIRLIRPTAGDLATLTRQLGPLQAPPAGPPDITVRFVDRMPDGRRLTYATWPESGFTDDTFYLLRGREGVAARTVLPFADVGNRCDIVCERRTGQVPHLLAVVNMTALTKGVLPLHASAFTYRGAGVLAAGWAKGGKTETLLAFASRGATYVGDEWVYLTPDGAMHGVPEPIRLWSWHVAQLPALASGLSRGVRARLSVVPAAATAATRLAERLPATTAAASALRRGAPVLRRQAYVQVPPERLFGADAVSLRGRMDVVLLLASHDRPDVTVEPIDGTEVARRMQASLAEERAPFMAAYRQFRFAFPDKRSDVVEGAAQTERDLLDQVFGDRRAHFVRHPYPVSLESLAQAIEPVLPITPNG